MSKCKTLKSFAGLWKNSYLSLMEAAMLGRGQLKEEICLMGTVVQIPHTVSGFCSVLSPALGREGPPHGPEAANATQLPFCWLSAM